MNSDEILLCDMQSELFEESIKSSGSSAIFIRRFMNSHVAKRFDNDSILNESKTMSSIITEINSEYDKEASGTQKYTNEEMAWIGYIYRYWHILYKTPSKRIYKICNSNEMRNLYYIYHTLDPKKAIDRILESKNIVVETDMLKKGVKALRLIRKQNKMEA